MFEHQLLPRVDIEQVNSETGRVYRLPDGTTFPSVTKFLAELPKPYLDKWKKRHGAEKAEQLRDYAANRGERLHRNVEAYLLNNKLPNTDSYDRTCFSKIKPALNKIDNIRLLESPLYSIKLGLAGTIDCLAEFEGKLTTIDFKSSTKVKKDEWIQNYYAQAGAYSIMVHERYGLSPLTCAIVVMTEELNVPQVFVKSTRDCIAVLKGYAVDLERHRRETT